MIAGVIFVIALVILALPAAYKQEIRGGIRSTVLRPFTATQEFVSAEGRPQVDVPALMTERDSLSALVVAQYTLAEENRRLRSLLALRGRTPESFIPAEVLKVGVLGAESTFLLNVGRAQGVVVGSPVISSGGLLGVVWSVEANSAQAIDWTHPEFRSSAMTGGGEAYGIVEPRRGRYREEDQLALTGAPFHVDIASGTRIVTSGRGGVFPRGIPLGTVIGIEEADTGWRKSYLLRPAVRPEAATHVLVGIGGDAAVADLSRLWNVEAPPDPARFPVDTAATGAAARDTSR